MDNVIFNPYLRYYIYLSTTLPVLRVVFVRASLQSNGATSLRRPRFLYCLLAASLAFTLFNVASFVWRLYGRKSVARMAPLVLQTIDWQSCAITENAPSRAFSWLKAATTAFKFKNLLRPTLC